MADRYFDIATSDHFWIRRRFQVLELLGGRLISDAQAIAEIGCGSGLLQRQVEETYGKAVAGFDLNELALKKNVSRMSSLHCYDILERHPSLHRRFDIVFLFDVLEHIRDETAFLDALIYHLSPAGHLILNVPAGQWAYSEYDRADGHVRRYSIRSLRQAIESVNLDIRSWTYWGLPLVPSILARKILLKGKTDKDAIVSAGFNGGGKLLKKSLGLLAKCEFIPQKIAGTSVMAILQLEPRKVSGRTPN